MNRDNAGNSQGYSLGPPDPALGTPQFHPPDPSGPANPPRAPRDPPKPPPSPLPTHSPSAMHSSTSVSPRSATWVGLGSLGTTRRGRRDCTELPGEGGGAQGPPRSPPKFMRNPPTPSGSPQTSGMDKDPSPKAPSSHGEGSQGGVWGVMIPKWGGVSHGGGGGIFPGEGFGGSSGGSQPRILGWSLLGRELGGSRGWLWGPHPTILGRNSLKRESRDPSGFSFWGPLGDLGRVWGVPPPRFRGGIPQERQFRGSPSFSFGGPLRDLGAGPGVSSVGFGGGFGDPLRDLGACLGAP